MTYTNNAAKLLSRYLRPLCQNEHKIDDTQNFASQLKEQPPLVEDEYVSYYKDSLFTNISVQKTIDYIIHQIYTEKKLPEICNKTIFRWLLLKWQERVRFSWNKNYTNKQKDVPWEVHYQQHCLIFIWFEQKMKPETPETNYPQKICSWHI